MNLKILLFAATLLYVSHEIQGSKILGVFWTPSKSHHILGSALMQALAKKGHNVTLLSPFIDDVDIPTFKQIKLEGIVGMLGVLASPHSTFLQATKVVLSSIRSAAENFWKNEAIQDLLQNKEQYDVVLLIPVLNDSLLGLFHYMKTPVVIFHPSGGNFLVNKYVGNPTLSYCANMHMNVGPLETFSGRLYGTTTSIFIGLMERFFIVPTLEEVMWEFIPNAPRVSELVKTVSLVLLNSHLSIELPRFTARNSKSKKFHDHDNDEVFPIYEIKSRALLARWTHTEFAESQAGL